jgi:hypothetical protein
LKNDFDEFFLIFGGVYLVFILLKSNFSFGLLFRIFYYFLGDIGCIEGLFDKLVGYLTYFLVLVLVNSTVFCFLRMELRVVD